MSHVDPGPMASYNSLSDPNLTSYFHNSRMKKHLVKTGLVTRRGEIVSEKVFRLNNARKEHQRHVRDLLAQAIVHKALDMERHRQMSIKKQLEEIGKVERVRRVRADRALRGDEDILPLLSAPPTRPKGKAERPHTAPAGRSSNQPDSSQPQTRQLPQSIGYPAIPGDSPYNTRSTRTGTAYPKVEIDNQYLSQLDQEALRSFTLNLSNYDLGSGVSPYVVPVLDPASREVLETMKPTKKRQRKRKKRPATAPVRNSRKEREYSSLSARSNKHSLELHRREPPMIYKKQPRSLCLITFKYLGQIVHLDRETEDPRDEVVVDQQHCGGGNLCVYRGKLLPGSNFTIISQRHRGYPFSLTFYLNGIIVERLSACCEYKHKAGFKLGAKTSHFGFVKIEGAHPCYKCLVASEKFRTTSDQSALAKNTFKKRDEKEELPPKKVVAKLAEETKYPDSFDSTVSESSSESESSVSSLTPVEDEKISSASESSASHVNLKDKSDSKGSDSSSSTQKSSSTKSLSTKSSKNSSSASGVSNAESSPRLKTESGKKKKSASSSSSLSSFSDDEEETIIHPEPTPLNVAIRAVSKKREKIDISHFAITDKQVEELCEILTDDSSSIVTLALYNCRLSPSRVTDILETIAGSCFNIKSVNIGRNGGVPVKSLLQLVEKTQIETLILDDNQLSAEAVNELMNGLKASYRKSPPNEAGIQEFKSASSKKVVSLGRSGKTSDIGSSSESSFHQLTLLNGSASGDHLEPSLRVLSLNRTGLGSEAIRVLADFLSTDPALSELHLNGNALTGDVLLPLWKALSSSRNTNLLSLSLASNRLNDQSMKVFADQMTDSSVLERLVLTKNSITDAGAAHLVRFVERNASIKYLFVSLGNNIKRKTLKRIKVGLNSNKLK